MKHCVHHKADLWLCAFSDLHDQMQHLCSCPEVIENIKIPENRDYLRFIVNLRNIDRIIADPDELLIIFRFDIYKTNPGEVPPIKIAEGSAVARTKGGPFVFSEFNFDDGLCKCGCGAKLF